MLKKGLIRTLIFEYIDKHNLTTVEQVFGNLPMIYDYLKNHPTFKDLIPETLTYDIFLNEAQIGFHQAQLRKHFIF